MKIFAAIFMLSIVVCSLTTPLWEHHDDGRHVFHACQNPSECEDGCCCSPFMACMHCHGFTCSAQTIEVPAEPYQNEFSYPPFLQHLTFYVGDIWQPPKIA